MKFVRLEVDGEREDSFRQTAVMGAEVLNWISVL